MIFFYRDHFGEVKLTCTVLVDPQGYVRYEDAPKLTIGLTQDQAETVLLEVPFWTARDKTPGMPAAAVSTAPQPFVALKKLTKLLLNYNSKTLKLVLEELVTGGTSILARRCGICKS